MKKKEFTQYSKKKNFLIKKRIFKSKKKEKKKKIISSFPRNMQVNQFCLSRNLGKFLEL